AAVAYGLLDLQTYCLAFIENYTQEVIQTRGFLELSEQAMQIILQSDNLAIDEVKLIHAVREWAHVGSAIMKECTALIRFRGLLASSSYKSCNAEGYADILQENCHSNLCWPCTHSLQAVLDRTVPDMARPVVPQLRLALLSPRELTSLEEENKKDQMIPVERFAEAWKTHALWKRRGMPSSLCQRRRGTLPR
ncbi:hypothetical protein Chor_003703, partial [Crotalus horridus]